MKKPDKLSHALFADSSKRMYNKDVEISYSIEGTTATMNNISLPAYEFHIIPLFYYDATSTVQYVRDLRLSSVSDDILWNMIDSENGMTGAGAFDRNTPG